MNNHHISENHRSAITRRTWLHGGTRQPCLKPRVTDPRPSILFHFALSSLVIMPVLHEPIDVKVSMLSFTTCKACFLNCPCSREPAHNRAVELLQPPTWSKCPPETSTVINPATAECPSTRNSIGLVDEIPHCLRSGASPHPSASSAN